MAQHGTRHASSRRRSLRLGVEVPGLDAQVLLELPRPLQAAPHVTVQRALVEALVVVAPEDPVR
eukprot:CAMPEP_0176313144 /NCGR_PEP_ID=MMETSP0121_2-20121125/67025_1 /TAXON_ID=160619 /ORGANISM="Kryptoperidinium foliaceum, Strain CCMP 1326" /LENGTH=63 /DNA_ID=CAMNT_0017655233 /DNA_START=13 /DNA_END=201 /DNA_ORIENTATION=-